MDKWISVKDRLPEHDQKILGVFDEQGSDWYKYPTTLNLLRYHKRDGKEYFKDGSSLHELKKGVVTHWMPIPEPPDEYKAVGLKAFIVELQKLINKFR